MKIVKIESCLDWKVAKIEICQNWKFPKPICFVIIKYVNDTGAWKWKIILEHESCQMPKLKIANVESDFIISC